MSDTYTGTPVLHGGITTVTDNDVISAAAISVPLEQLQDEIMSLNNMKPDVTVFDTAGDFTYDVPAYTQFLDVICVGHGGDGGNGAGSAGGGGGGSGDVKVRRLLVAIDGVPASGIVFSTSCAIHVPAVGSNQVCSFLNASNGVYIAANPGSDGAAGAGGVGGAGGAAGGTGGAAGAAGGNTGAGSSAAADGYSRPGGGARSAGNPGLGGPGYGGGGGGGTNSGAGGSGAGGFAGNTAAGTGAAGSGATGGAGGPALLVVIAWPRPLVTGEAL